MNVPFFVLGVSIIRGAPTPVIDLGALCGAAPARSNGRFVTLRIDERIVALSVEAVLSVRASHELELHNLPLLLGESSAELIEAFGRMDGELLVVLRTARLVPASVWDVLATKSEAAS